MVLVTGGTGLLGTHLILALHKAGKQVRAIYRNQIPAVVQHKAQWVQADLLDVTALQDALQGITEVYHCAGYVSFHKRHRHQLYKVNVEGTANMVNACLSNGVRKLIHVSSVAALGRIRQGPINESMHWSPETSNSEYGKTKYLGEMEVWRGITERVTAAIVNPTIIIGEHGNWSQGSMQIFESIAKGFKFYSLGKTGFVDANDVANSMMALMESPIQAERFIISAENTSYQQFFNMIADGLGVQRPSIKVTPFKAAIAWRLYWLLSKLTGKDALVTAETAATSLAVVHFDNSKLLKAIPSFSYTPLVQSVERICNYYKTIASR